MSGVYPQAPTNEFVAVVITHSSPVITAEPDTAVLEGVEPKPVESKLHAPPVTFEMDIVPFVVHDVGLVVERVAAVAI